MVPYIFLNIYQMHSNSRIWSWAIMSNIIMNKHSNSICRKLAEVKSSIFDWMRKFMDEVVASDILYYFCVQYFHQTFYLLGNKWNYDKFVSYKDMLRNIREVYPNIERVDDSLNDTSKVWNCTILLPFRYKYAHMYTRSPVAYKPKHAHTHTHECTYTYTERHTYTYIHAG